VLVSRTALKAPTQQTDNAKNAIVLAHHALMVLLTHAQHALPISMFKEIVVVFQVAQLVNTFSIKCAQAVVLLVTNVKTLKHALNVLLPTNFKVVLAKHLVMPDTTQAIIYVHSALMDAPLAQLLALAQLAMLTSYLAAMVYVLQDVLMVNTYSIVSALFVIHHVLLAKTAKLA